MIKKDIRYVCKKSPSRLIILKDYIDSKIYELKQYYYKNNKKEISFNNDIWIVYYPDKENFRCTEINFSNLRNPIKKETMHFIKETIFLGVYSKNKAKENRVIDIISLFDINHGIHSASDIKEWHILSILHHLETKKLYIPATLSSSLTLLRKFFNSLISSNLSNKPKSNPTDNIKFSNTSGYTKNTPSIPEDILIFLDNHVNEIRKDDVILMYYILMETGWRFGDVIELKVDCCSKDDKADFANIWVDSPKTRISRIKRGLGNIVEDIISVELYYMIEDYIKKTKVIREAYNIDTLFFSIGSGVIQRYSPITFNTALQNLCKKHGIKSIDETYWQVSSRQTRKTVAVSLISSGASSSSVQKKLGHVTSYTTELYYAEVQKKVIGELNTTFFQNHFSVIMDEDKLKLFTEEERRILYVDFSLNHRNVELGQCSKHPSEGLCPTIGYTSCGNCPKICTGIAFLGQWEKLAYDSKELLLQFIKTYKENNIEASEYETYIEYCQEKKLYEHYLTVIEEIKHNK